MAIDFWSNPQCQCLPPIERNFPAIRKVFWSTGKSVIDSCRPWLHWQIEKIQPNYHRTSKIKKTRLLFVLFSGIGFTKCHPANKAYWLRRKIRLIEGNAKCRHLKNWSYKGNLRQVFICLKSPPFLDFCLGWSSNLVGSESGQIQSGKLLENMVSRTTQHQPPLTQIYSILIYTGTGGGELNQREGRGAT